MDDRQAPGTADYDALPAEDITIDQVAAWNMRHWRQARHMTQEDLGKRIGWSAANVSAAERSASGDRERRRFDAQTLAAVADALDIPVVALFLPPEDDGQGKRYQWHANGSAARDMGDLMQLAMHDNEDDGVAMAEYRDRYQGAATAYLGEDWGREAGQWFAPMDDKEKRGEAASRFRSRQSRLLAMAAEDGAIADFLNPEEQ